MIDLAIVVEGQTEEQFVKRVLSPSLSACGISSWAVLPGEGHARRGGRWLWSSVRRDLARLLKERSDRYCSLLFDYYALPSDWPGREDASKSGVPVQDRARIVEDALQADAIDSLEAGFRPERFIPHIQLHEFEARLFSDTGALASSLGVPQRQLDDIVSDSGGPERIDDGVESAPSKRLEALCQDHRRTRYRKVVEGVTAAERVTLERMRQACPHFAGWLAAIEAIGQKP